MLFDLRFESLRCPQYKRRRRKSSGGLGDRFSALTFDDDDKEEEVDWEDVDRDIKEGNLPKYTGVEVDEEIISKMTIDSKLLLFCAQ